jgi:S-formylglutathione hydrolase FrmB
MINSAKVWSRAAALVFVAICAFAQDSPTKAQKAPSHAKEEASKPETARGSKEVSVRDETFHSDSLGRDMKYRVILPVGYASSQHHYPVLYLLHGALGSYVDWESRTNVDDYVRDLPLIVVMPDADESWYTNSATVPEDRYEDYIIKDVIREVEGKFRAVRAQYARAIAGLSMGGYGAVKFALKYPNSFAFAASFSGAFEVPEDIEKSSDEFFHDIWLKVFGPADNPTRADNDLIQLAQRVRANVVPYLWLSCGTGDNLLEFNRAVVRELKLRGIAYEYHEAPGAHSWKFWDAQLRVMLPSLMEHLKSH